MGVCGSRNHTNSTGPQKPSPKKYRETMAINSKIHSPDLNPNDINKDKLSQINIIYEIKSYNDSITLFGDDFVQNNSNNCYLLIENKQIKLLKQLTLSEKQKKQKTLEIILIETNKITNMSHMFYDCSSLISLPDLSKWDTKNITNMSYMFYGCSSLNYFPGISEWDTENVTNMSCMFRYCHLILLPDISKWDTKNVLI